MAEINMTFNHDIQGYKKTQAKKIAEHNKHDPAKNHKNKGILYGDTKYNFITDDPLEYMNAHIKELYEPEVERRNAHLLESVESNKISQQKYLERLTTVNSLTDNKIVCSGIVMQMGSLETMIELQDALGIDYDLKTVKDKDGNEYERPVVKDPKDQEKWANFWSETYRDAFRTSFLNSDAFRPFQAAVHLDEATPHMHIACVNNGGKTKTGKQRSTINSTVIEFLEEKGIGIQSDNRANLRAFRAYTDQVLYESAQKMLTKYYPDKDVTLNFTRTGGKTGLSEDAYHELASVNSKVKKAKKELNDVETQKKDAVSSFKDSLRQLRQMEAKNAQMHLQAQENEERIKEQQKELEELKAKAEQRKAKERELEQREAKVEQREADADLAERLLHAKGAYDEYDMFKSFADEFGKNLYLCGVTHVTAEKVRTRRLYSWESVKKRLHDKVSMDRWLDKLLPSRTNQSNGRNKSKAKDDGLEL